MSKNPHPGEILRKDFMEPRDLSATGLALALRVPPNRITNIIRGRRRITAETALRLSRYFKNTPEYWMTLQTAHDLGLAEKEKGSKIQKEVLPSHYLR